MMLGSSCSPCCAPIDPNCSIEGLESRLPGFNVEWSTDGFTAGVWPNNGDSFEVLAPVYTQNGLSSECRLVLTESWAGTYFDQSDTQTLIPGSEYNPNFLPIDPPGIYTPPGQIIQGTGNPLNSSGIGNRILAALHCGSESSPFDTGDYLWAFVRADVVVAEGLTTTSVALPFYEEILHSSYNYSFSSQHVFFSPTQYEIPANAQYHQFRSQVFPFTLYSFLTWSGERPTQLTRLPGASYLNPPVIALDKYILQGDAVAVHQLAASSTIIWPSTSTPQKLVARFTFPAVRVGEYVGGQYQITETTTQSNFHQLLPSGVFPVVYPWAFGRIPTFNITQRIIGIARDSQYPNWVGDPLPVNAELAARYPVGHRAAGFVSDNHTAIASIAAGIGIPVRPFTGDPKWYPREFAGYDAPAGTAVPPNTAGQCPELGVFFSKDEGYHPGTKLWNFIGEPRYYSDGPTMTVRIFPQ